MDELSQQEKVRNRRPFVILGLVSLLILSSCWSCWRWYHIIQKQLVKIENAPIDPEGPASFAFFNMHPNADVLVDPVLNICCHGHELTRQVQQYVRLQQDSPPMPILVVQDAPLSGGEFPLSSQLFESDWVHSDRYSVPKSAIPINMTESQPFQIQPLEPRPPSWKKVTARNFFWGESVSRPQSGNIDVSYTCSVVPRISLWGSVDEQGVITPDKWYSGVNWLSAADQKERMIYSTETFLLSSIAIHCFIINALVLIVLKERFMSGSLRRFGQMLLSLRSYDVLLSPILLFITPSFVTALIVCTLLITYCGCYVFAKKQQEQWLEIQRIDLYR